MKYRLIQDSENFFTIKSKAQKLFLEILNGHSSKSEHQIQFESYIKEMLKIAEDYKVLYFIERIKAIQGRFNILQISNFKDSLEAKRINSIFAKIDDSETAQFLNSILNKKLDKIVQKKIDTNSEISTQNFYVLSFQTSIIIVPKVKKRILKNIEYSKKYISLNNQKILIFPISPLIIESPEGINTKSNILILNLGTESKCIRFDSFLSEENFDSIELAERKVETFSLYEDLKYFLRWRGRDCFYFDFHSNRPEIFL